jgi:hypothetical protein
VVHQEVLDLAVQAVQVVPLDLQVHQAVPVHQAAVEAQVPPVLQEQAVAQVLQALADHLVRLDQADLLGQVDLPEHQEVVDQAARLDLQVLVDHQELPAHPVHQVLQAQADQAVALAHPDLLEHQVHLVQVEALDQVDLPAVLVHQVLQEQAAAQDHLVLAVHQDHPVL